MRKLAALGLFLASLTYGCVKAHNLAPVPVMLPNGAQGAVVLCQLKSECFQLSTYVCGKGYSIIQAHDQPATDFTSSDRDVEYIIQCYPEKEAKVAEGETK